MRSGISHLASYAASVSAAQAWLDPDSQLLILLTAIGAITVIMGLGCSVLIRLWHERYPIIVLGASSSKTEERPEIRKAA